MDGLEITGTLVGLLYLWFEYRATVSYKHPRVHETLLCPLCRLLVVNKISALVN